MNAKRNIQTTAPFLADVVIELHEPIFDISKYSFFLDNNSNRLGKLKKYLICKLHDSRIIEVNESIDKFRLSLNDYTTFIFANKIIDKNNLPIKSNNISFPLTIELSGNLKVEYNQVDDDGNLFQIEQTHLDEYLYEQVTHLDEEKIEIVFLFWKSNIKHDRAGENIIVIVSANELHLIENQDQSWTAVFGDKFDDLYNYFKEQRNRDRFLSNQSECEKLIGEFEQTQLINERKP